MKPSVCLNSRSIWSKCVPGELRWLGYHIRPFLPWHAASFLCIAAGSLLALVTPFVLAHLIDVVLPRRSLGSLIGMVLLLFLGYEGRTLFTSLGGCVTLAAAQRMGLRLRLAVLHHMSGLSSSYFEKVQPGAAVYALEEPIDEIAYLGSELFPSILRTVLTLAFTVGAMLWLSFALSAIVFPLVPFFLILRQHFRKKLSACSDQVHSQRQDLTSFLQEHLSSVISIQLLGAEKRQERKAFLLLARIACSHLKLFMASLCFTASTALAVALAMSTVIGYGGWRVFSGALTIGNLVAFYGLVTQLFDPLSGATEMYARTQKTFASIRQIQQVFALTPNIADCSNPVVLREEDSSQIDIDAMRFRYEPQRGTLHVRSLRILAGEQVAVVGQNGSGKSTLAKLMVRMYDVAAGSISIGGKDIRGIQLASLRRFVCYMPRDPVLFSGTLAANLRFVSPGASQEELRRVLETVGLSALMASREGGLGREIGPGGCQLSGGQRQRLAIARSLLQRPQILILDEATSCLDPASEELVLRNIMRNLPHSTLIVVSHRLSTVSVFPRILVVADGNIVADGTPESLSPRSTAYSELFSDRNANAPLLPRFNRVQRI
jgi:ABC-type multidrug transport system fused ATPase/permease subunit